MCGRIPTESHYFKQMRKPQLSHLTFKLFTALRCALGASIVCAQRALPAYQNSARERRI